MSTKNYYLEWFNIHYGVRYTILRDCNEQQLKEYLYCLDIEDNEDIKVQEIK